MLFTLVACFIGLSALAADTDETLRSQAEEFLAEVEHRYDGILEADPYGFLRLRNDASESEILALSADLESIPDLEKLFIVRKRYVKAVNRIRIEYLVRAMAYSEAEAEAASASSGGPVQVAVQGIRDHVFRCSRRRERFRRDEVLIPGLLEKIRTGEAEDLSGAAKLLGEEAEGFLHRWGIADVPEHRYDPALAAYRHALTLARSPGSARRPEQAAFILERTVLSVALEDALARVPPIDFAGIGIAPDVDGRGDIEAQRKRIHEAFSLVDWDDADLAERVNAGSGLKVTPKLLSDAAKLYADVEDLSGSGLLGLSDRTWAWINGVAQTIALTAAPAGYVAAAGEYVALGIGLQAMGARSLAALAWRSPLRAWALFAATQATGAMVFGGALTGIHWLWEGQAALDRIERDFLIGSMAYFGFRGANFLTNRFVANRILARHALRAASHPWLDRPILSPAARLTSGTVGVALGEAPVLALSRYGGAWVDPEISPPKSPAHAYVEGILLSFCLRAGRIGFGLGLRTTIEAGRSMASAANRMSTWLSPPPTSAPGAWPILQPAFSPAMPSRPPLRPIGLPPVPGVNVYRTGTGGHRPDTGLARADRLLGASAPWQANPNLRLCTLNGVSPAERPLVRDSIRGRLALSGPVIEIPVEELNPNPIAALAKRVPEIFPGGCKQAQPVSTVRAIVDHLESGLGSVFDARSPVTILVPDFLSGPLQTSDHVLAALNRLLADWQGRPVPISALRVVVITESVQAQRGGVEPRHPDISDDGVAMRLGKDSIEGFERTVQRTIESGKVLPELMFSSAIPDLKVQMEAFRIAARYDWFLAREEDARARLGIFWEPNSEHMRILEELRGRFEKTTGIPAELDVLTSFRRLRVDWLDLNLQKALADQKASSGSGSSALGRVNDMASIAMRLSAWKVQPYDTSWMVVKPAFQAWEVIPDLQWSRANADAKLIADNRGKLVYFPDSAGWKLDSPLIAGRDTWVVSIGPEELLHRNLLRDGWIEQGLRELQIEEMLVHGIDNLFHGWIGQPQRHDRDSFSSRRSLVEMASLTCASQAWGESFSGLSPRVPPKDSLSGFVDEAQAARREDVVRKFEMTLKRAARRAGSIAGILEEPVQRWNRQEADPHDHVSMLGSPGGPGLRDVSVFFRSGADEYHALIPVNARQVEYGVSAAVWNKLSRVYGISVKLEGHLSRAHQAVVDFDMKTALREVGYARDLVYVEWQR